MAHESLLLLAVGGGAVEVGKTAAIEGRVQAKRAVEAVGERSVGRRADRAVPGEALRLLFPFLPCASTGGPGVAHIHSWSNIPDLAE